jgi:hypothetical protein
LEKTLNHRAQAKMQARVVMLITCKKRAPEARRLCREINQSKIRQGHREAKEVRSIGNLRLRDLKG